MNCDLFVMELENNFGTFNPEGEAEAKLKQLSMHENHQATNHFLKFQQLATQVKLGDAALHQQAHNSLAKHLRTTWFTTISQTPSLVSCYIP